MKNILYGLLAVAVVLSMNIVRVESLLAAVIPPIGGQGPTLTILDSTGRDVSTGWLPEPGQTYTLQINGTAVTSLALEATSEYPGICTNYGTDAGPDFVLVGNQLTSNDCGGRTTLNVNGTVRFLLPPDADGDGLPDAWEAQFGNLNPADDIELNPSVVETTDNNRRGDGLAAIDEYRGFIVSIADGAPGVPYAALSGTKHIRTIPTQKDYFGHIAAGQCAPASPPVPHGTLARYFPANGPDIFEFVHTLIPGFQFHRLDDTSGGTNPARTVLWEDFFDSFSQNTVLYRTSAGLQTNRESDVPTDRRINGNAVFPITDVLTNQPIQKGIRVVECQLVDTSTQFGVADQGTPNKALSAFSVHAGNAIVYPERMRKDIQTKLTNAGSRRIFWALYDVNTRVWVTQSPELAPNGSLTTQDFLTSRMLRYVLSHEITHALFLENSSTNGYHTSTASGNMMDAQMSITQDKSGSGKTTFRIPSLYFTSDQQTFKTKN